MSDVIERLKKNFRDPEYRHTYDDGFLNSSLATQIKVLREERGWTQAKLAAEAKMNQSRISELEDVNFDSWTIRTLRKLSRAFDLRLKISFEEFATLLSDFRDLNRDALSRRSFEHDPSFSVGPRPPKAEREEDGVEIEVRLPRQTKALTGAMQAAANAKAGTFQPEILPAGTAQEMGWRISGNNPIPMAPASHQSNVLREDAA